MIHPLVTCLWFDGQAEEAAQLYATVFDDARIGRTLHYRGEAARVSGIAEGTVLTVTVHIGDQSLTLLNAGPQFPFTEAISVMVPCDTQDEIDHIWDGLTDGGEPSQCGWLKDRFGVSWQVVPAELEAMLGDDDPERARRVSDALMGMQRLDIACLRAAADGVAVAPS